MPVNNLIQVRRGTLTQWSTANPTLSVGEIGFESDTGKFKIGDGTLAWNALDYAGGGGGNLDGGEADTNYGGISSIDGGNAELA
jgi:hypothetical protein